MTANEIKALMDEYSEEYGIVAIRTQEEEFEMGTICHNSRVWIDGEETDEELDGVCGTVVKGLEYHLDTYYGDHVAIIAGDYYGYGEDPYEVIIRDAEVINIIK